MLPACFIDGFHKMSEHSDELKLKDLENQPEGTEIPLARFLKLVKFNADGLIPAIAQQHDTKEVLMMAWMNQAALLETINTQRVCYYSRSRQGLWRKGESSGQTQLLKSLAFDCDGDCIVMQVDQTGPACHTGRRDCFFFEVKGNQIVINSKPLIDPSELYK